MLCCIFQGVISTVVDLDRESQSEYILVVSAVDQAAKRRRTGRLVLPR